MHDFRRDSEPQRHDAGAQSARHDHLAAILGDVVVGIAGAVGRGNERGPQQRQPDLSAMGMARQRERHLVRHTRKDVGLVHEQKDRIIGAHTRERTGQVVLTPELVARDAVGDLVAKSRQPEAVTFLAEMHRLVFEQWNTDLAKRLADAINVVPPIVIAEDGQTPSAARSRLSSAAQTACGTIGSTNLWVAK